MDRLPRLVPRGEERQRIRAKHGPMTGSARLRTMLRIAGRTMRPGLWPTSFETPASRGLLRMRSLSRYDAVRRGRASKPVLVRFDQPHQHLEKGGLFGLAERGKRMRIETLAEPAGFVGAPLARGADAELDCPLVPRGPLALQNAGLFHPRQDLHQVRQLHFQHAGKL